MKSYFTTQMVPSEIPVHSVGGSFSGHTIVVLQITSYMENSSIPVVTCFCNNFQIRFTPLVVRVLTLERVILYHEEFHLHVSILSSKHYHQCNYMNMM